MSNNRDEVDAALSAAGIPSFVLTTTLPLQQQHGLRTYVVGKQYEHPGGRRGVVVYPEKAGDEVQARKVFYLVAKELVLSRQSVYCIPLAAIAESLESQETSYAMDRAEGVKFVFITDFYEKGAPPPLSPYIASRVRAWIRGKIEAGNAVSLLSDSALRGTEAWWPPSFLAFLSENTIAYAVGRGK